MAGWLTTQGHVVNRKRAAPDAARRIGGDLPATEHKQAGGAHKIYLYLLGRMLIERVNQVRWSDATYIPMAKGFLVVIVSRAVLAWRPSNTLVAESCVEALKGSSLSVRPPRSSIPLVDKD